MASLGTPVVELTLRDNKRVAPQVVPFLCTPFIVNMAPPGLKGKLKASEVK